MKKIYLLTRFCLFAVLLCTVFACKEDEAVVTPVFPEGETVETVVPGTEYTLTFTANMSWELKSSALWCKFSNGFTSIKGEAGEISQKVTISSDAMTLEDDKAEITLIMGGEEKVIAEYTREGLVPEVKDANGNLYSEENPLAFEYTNNGVEIIATFTVNYDWTLAESDLPEWVKLDESSEYGGNAGESVLVSLYVPETYWLSAQEGTITVRNSEIGCEFSIPVKYTGMPSGEIVIDGINGSAYWWTIAADGKTFWKENSMSETEPEIINIPFTFNVLAKDNAYKVVHVEQSGSWLNVMDEWSMPFVKLSDNGNGNITIESVSANSTQSERTAYILVMPTSIYDEMMEKVNSNGGIYDGILLTDTGDGINAGDETHTNYDKYTVLAFKQEVSMSEVEAFNVLSNGETIECLQGDGNTGIAGYISSEFSVSENMIYSVSVNKNASITIDPMLSEMDWDGSNLSFSTIAKYMDGTSVDTSVWEPSYNDTEFRYNFTLSVGESSFFIIFRGNDYLNKKALIIQVNE